MRIAVQQQRGTPGDVAANLAALDLGVAEATTWGAELVVFPELFLSGYWIGDDARALALDVDGAECAEVGHIAARHGAAVCVGYPQRAGGGTYNAAMLVDARGAVLGHYRKRRAVGEYECATFLNGDEDLVVELNGVRTGVLICYDSEFPENVRRLALQGVELLLVPTALSLEYAVVARCVIPARAFESSLYIAYADRWGCEDGKRYAGGSCICAPDGEFLARAEVDGDRLLMTEIDTAAVHRARQALPYLRDCESLPG
jgi:predicted amidohydrolase